jgi:hypothetical protein
VLNPSCIRCHAWAADEASVQQRIIAGDPENSILYQKIKDGSMPPSGPLSTSNLQLVERYIRTIKTTPNVPPTIAIDSTFKSIQFHLIQKSCFTCHNSSSGEISFDGYENIKRYSSIIIDALDNGESEGSPMPPIGANGKRMAPVPTPQIVEAFRGWINAGKIDN